MPFQTRIILFRCVDSVTQVVFLVFYADR